MSEMVRVLRILEYVGDREWVENTLNRGGVPMNGVVKDKFKDGCIIKSAIIDKFPEIFKEENDIVIEEKNKERDPLIPDWVYNNR